MQLKQKLSGADTESIATLTGIAIRSGVSERRFTLRKSVVEHAIKYDFVKGMTYEIEGVIEGVGSFRYRHRENRSHYLSIHLPSDYSDRVKIGETYRIKITKVSESHELDALNRQDRVGDQLQQPNKKAKRRLGRWIEHELTRMRKKEIHHATNGKSEAARSFGGRSVEDQQKFQTGAEQSPEKSENGNSWFSSEERMLANDRTQVRERLTIGSSQEARDGQHRSEWAGNDNLISWEWVAGFFDGEGSICLHLQMDSIRFEVNFSQKYRPLLDEVVSFLKKEGIYSTAHMSKTDNVHRIMIQEYGNIKAFLEKIQPLLHLKQGQARATIDYLDDMINGDELVQIMNEEIIASRRSGKLRRLPGQTLTRGQSIRNSKLSGLQKARVALFAPLQALDEAKEESLGSP